MKLGIVALSNSLLEAIDSNEKEAIPFNHNFRFMSREISMIYAGTHDCLLESDLFEELEEGQRIPRYILEFDGGKVEVSKEEEFQTL